MSMSLILPFVVGLGVLLVRGLLRLPDEAATHHNV